MQQVMRCCAWQLVFGTVGVVYNTPNMASLNAPQCALGLLASPEENVMCMSGGTFGWSSV